MLELHDADTMRTRCGHNAVEFTHNGETQWGINYVGMECTICEGVECATQMLGKINPKFILWCSFQ
jgi:hypothetical protein